VECPNTQTSEPYFQNQAAYNNNNNADNDAHGNMIPVRPAELDKTQAVADNVTAAAATRAPSDEARSKTATMEALLSRIYYDVTHKAGFSSIRKLYQAVKAKKEGYTLNFVKQWLRGQEAYNLFKPVLDGMDACWEMDLMIMRHVFTADGSEKEMALPEANDGYAYILVVVDAFYKWAQPCKTKTSQEVATAFEAVLWMATPGGPHHCAQIWEGNLRINHLLMSLRRWVDRISGPIQI